MSFDAVEKIADAVLFEGYILYPYRPSSIKNQKRWNFGTLFPRGFAKTQSPEESWRFDTEVLVKVSDATAVTARARFLEVAPPEGGGEQGWEEGFVRMREVQATIAGDVRGCRALFRFK
jgi:hydrogenase maturation protease